MGQKLSILESWFVSKSNNRHRSISVREVGELILKKGLANDIDSAIKIVYSQLKLSPEKADSNYKLDLDAFNRIFILSLLKSSFLDVLARIDAQAGDRDISLAVKIENYQRKYMLMGLEKQRDGKVNASALL